MKFSCETREGIEYQAVEIDLTRYWRSKNITSTVHKWEYIAERSVPIGIVYEAKKFFKFKN